MRSRTRERTNQETSHAEFNDRRNRIHRMFPSRTNPPSILSILYILSKKQSQPRLNGVAMSSSPREQVDPVAACELACRA